MLHFVNADLIAAGLSPLNPPAAQVAAARILLRGLDRLSAEREVFAFKTTMSGRVYLERLREWKTSRYRIEMVFLKLDSINMALKRIELRVRNGGHDVPVADVRRRFKRGWANCGARYKELADQRAVYDNTADTIELIESNHE